MPQHGDRDTNTPVRLVALHGVAGSACYSLVADLCRGLMHHGLIEADAPAVDVYCSEKEKP